MINHFLVCGLERLRRGGVDMRDDSACECTPAHPACAQDSEAPRRKPIYDRWYVQGAGCLVAGPALLVLVGCCAFDFIYNHTIYYLTRRLGRRRGTKGRGVDDWATTSWDEGIK